MSKRNPGIPKQVALDCHPGECSGAPTVHVDIYTHELTYKIDASDIISHNVKGHIVAKLVNRDAYAFEALRLAANDTAYL